MARDHARPRRFGAVTAQEQAWGLFGTSPPQCLLVRSQRPHVLKGRWPYSAEPALCSTWIAERSHRSGPVTGSCAGPAMPRCAAAADRRRDERQSDLAHVPGVCRIPLREASGGRAAGEARPSPARLSRLWLAADCSYICIKSLYILVTGVNWHELRTCGGGLAGCTSSESGIGGSTGRTRPDSDAMNRNISKVGVHINAIYEIYSLCIFCT